jgi:hypothetical protein
MPAVLKDLRIEEISLVDWPANEHSVVALKKRDDSADTTIYKCAGAIYERTKQPNGTFLFQKRAIPTPGELALPMYRPATDPQFQELSRPKEGETMPIMTTSNTDKRKKKRKFSTMLGKIAKGDPSVSLLDQEIQVRKKAERVAARSGVSVAKAESDIWKDLHEKGLIAPDDLEARKEKVNIAKRRVNEFGLPMTKAEASIEVIAKSIQARTGCSIAKAIATAWKDNSDLYQQYLTEFNDDAFQQKVSKAMAEDAGHKNASVFDPEDQDDEDDEEDDEDEADQKDKRNKPKSKCTKCNTVNKADGAHNYCFNCGTRLAKPKAS